VLTGTCFAIKLKQQKTDYNQVVFLAPSIKEALLPMDFYLQQSGVPVGSFYTDSLASIGK